MLTIFLYYDTIIECTGQYESVYNNGKKSIFHKNMVILKMMLSEAQVLRESVFWVILVYTRGENSWYILSKLEKEQE
jgi:hypothetical protein